MKAPKGEGESHHQKRSRDASPGGAIVIAPLASAGRNSTRHRSQHGRILRCNFGDDGRAGSHEIGDGLVFIETKMSGISADESLVKNATRKLIEMLLFESG